MVLRHKLDQEGAAMKLAGFSEGKQTKQGSSGGKKVWLVYDRRECVVFKYSHQQHVRMNRLQCMMSWEN